MQQPTAHFFLVFDSMFATLQNPHTALDCPGSGCPIKRVHNHPLTDFCKITTTEIRLPNIERGLRLFAGLAMRAGTPELPRMRQKFESPPEARRLDGEFAVKQLHCQNGRVP